MTEREIQDYLNILIARAFLNRSSPLDALSGSIMEAFTLTPKQITLDRMKDYA